MHGDPDRSPLIPAVRQSGALKMPPREKLADAEVAALVRCIEDGAPDLRDVDSAGVIGSLNSYQNRAWELITSPRVRDAFDYDSEPQTVKDRFGQFGDSVERRRARSTRQQLCPRCGQPGQSREIEVASVGGEGFQNVVGDGLQLRQPQRPLLAGKQFRQGR